MITKNQFISLENIYSYYNKILFNGTLPDCIINLSRHGGAYGFFISKYWKSQRDNNITAHEISINPDHINRPEIDWHSTLVHEMCHLWQEEFGKPGRKFYHNRQWADKMEELGLMPSSTGKPGGSCIGQSMSHYIIEYGHFHLAFNDLFKTNLSAGDLYDFRLLYKPTVGKNPAKPLNPDDDNNDTAADDEGKAGKRIKYTCDCGNNVWGKAGLNITCCDCKTMFLITS